jgi:Lipase (class 3)
VNSHASCRHYTLCVYTYGSPRVGNAQFVHDFNALMLDSWRCQNVRDIVPHLAPWPMGYRHIKHAATLSSGGGLKLPDGGYLRVGKKGRPIAVKQVRKAARELRRRKPHPMRALGLRVRGRWAATTWRMRALMLHSCHELSRNLRPARSMTGALRNVATHAGSVLPVQAVL